MAPVGNQYSDSLNAIVRLKFLFQIQYIPFSMRISISHFWQINWNDYLSHGTNMHALRKINFEHYPKCKYRISVECTIHSCLPNRVVWQNSKRKGIHEQANMVVVEKNSVHYISSVKLLSFRILSMHSMQW